MKLLKILCVVLFSGLGFSTMAQTIIPKPYTMNVSKGEFIIDRNTSFGEVSKELEPLKDYFAQQIKELSDLDITAADSKAKKKINLKIQPIEFKNNPEAYRLLVTPEEITLTANHPRGIFYAMQSLLQLLPPVRNNATLSVPALEILDVPEIAWRGLMLDSVRHFYSVETIKELIDLMALFKLNVFHWHLCDDQGWRLEIKKYPKLTEVGAWREEKEDALFYDKDSLHLQQVKNNPTYHYGGFYTQEQVKDIIDYAQLRGITIIPEIEMPGHSGAALAAYPELSCKGNPQPVPTIYDSADFSSFNSNYCPGNPETFKFLENIIDEVVELFPSEYIHIGGDEVNKTDWKNCEKCQKMMEFQSIKDEEVLQSYFIHRMEKYINLKGKTIIGWDEILEGGLAPNAIVMSWRGEKGGIKAAKMKHSVIMSPSKPLYFIRHQTEDKDCEPHAPSFSINTLKKVYDYSPYPKELTPEEHSYIKGVQAAIWTEFIPSEDHLYYMLFPRLIALSETLWTAPELKDYEDFKLRLKPVLRGFDQKGVRYFKKFE